MKQETIPILRILNHASEEPLVEVFKPTDKDVEAKIKILRKGGLVDPKRWIERGNQFLHRKNFESAQTCFQKADDDRGITTVRAFLKEQEARSYNAQNHHDNFIKESEAAVELFLQVQLISNASTCLENMEQYERAAWLWYDTKNYGKAAHLFQLADSFEKASQCYHFDGNFGKAAEVLRMGNLYDQLIAYLDENHDHIEPDFCQKYGRLCNLLLKQGRISPNLRAMTIKLLGSKEKQEQFFKKFEMTTHLAEFYERQGRSAELFQLLIEDGQLRPALDAASKSHTRSHEHEIETAFNLLHVQKLFWEQSTELSPSLFPSDWKDTLPHSLVSASADWNAVSRILNPVKKGQMSGTLAEVQNEIIKECLCLHIVLFLPDYIKHTSSISDLPIEIIKVVVVALVQKLSSGKYELYSTSLLLICGVFETPSRKEIYLPWSPLRHPGVSESVSAVSQRTQTVATQWILDRLSLAATAFDERARNMWTIEWPRQCFWFLSQKQCFKALSNECRYSHKYPSKEECSLMLTGLLQVASVFTAMSRLYLTRVMNENFRENFLSRRRFWLEKLIRSLTYVSAIDQASSAVTEAISILHSNQAYLTVGFGLENLLFHRIGKEWQDRSSLSSLLGQYELSLLLGNEVNKNFLQATRRNINYCLGPEGSLDYMGDQLHELRMARQAIESFHQIRAAISESNENILHKNLRSFLGSFYTINVYSLSEFHAVTTSFEYIATFLLYARRPVQSIVLPHSWTVLHLVPIIQLSSPKLAVSSQAERSRYTKHLLELFNHFSGLLSYLDKSADGNPEFSCNGRRLPSSMILQRRNVELLAVIALNMGSERTLDGDFGNIWDGIKAFFALP